MLRHGHLDEPAIRRAARGLRQQVLAHAVRAAGVHQEPRYSHRQERGRLHLPLAGHSRSCRATRRRVKAWRQEGRRVSAGKVSAGNGGDDGETVTKPVTTKADGQAVGQDQARGENGNGTVESALTAARTNGAAASHANGYSDRLLERAGVKLKSSEGSQRSEQFAGFQTDAPSCDSCGAITVRNGNCYLCHNCGNSMGCS